MDSYLSKVLGWFGLQRLQAQGADPNNPAIWSPLGGTHPIIQTTNSGETITLERALSVGAYYAGVKFISQTIGMTPISMYRRIDDKVKEKAPEHPIHHILHSEPSPYWTPMTWKQQMTGDAINAGGGFSRIVWRGSAVDRLIPLNPFAVTTEFLDNGEPLYLLNKGTENEKRIPFDDMFHLPGFGGNFNGISTIVLAKETLGLALALEQHATRLFSNGAVLGGTIEFPTLLNKRGEPVAIGKDTIGRLRDSFRRDAEGSEKAHKWHILEYGAQAKPIGNTNVESQFLEARRFIIEEIARWLGIRQHTLGALERAIKSNIEEAARELLIFDIMPWYVKWEQVIKRDLILAPQKYHAEFNMEMLLRGETLKRWQSHKIAVELGARSPNEVRALEGDNPRSDGRGDRYWEPEANYSTGAGATAEGDGAEESVDATPGPPPPEPPGSLRARTIVKKAVDGLVRKEIAAIGLWGPRHASKAGDWERWLDVWYEKHQAILVDRLALAPEAAKAYCAMNKEEILSTSYTAAAGWLPQRKRLLIAAVIEEN